MFLLYQRQWPFYQGRWPFYHASLKRLSNSAVAASLEISKERKEILVDPGRAQISRFRKKEKETLLILPVVICLSQRLIHSAVARSLDLEHGQQFLPFPV